MSVFDIAQAPTLQSDCRLPEYRVETFLRFYEFHLRYRAHPGGVYYFMPYLAERKGWNLEQRLWFAFINGNTQHPMTSMLLFERGPSPADAQGAVEFWRKEYPRLAFDTDRRYHKKSFDRAVESMLSLSGGDIVDYFGTAAAGGWPEVWKASTAIHTFGRLSAFSFAEYLRIMGLDFDCADLMVGDSGSASHRNGLCIVSGHSEWDSHPTNPLSPAGHYGPKQIEYLTRVGADLLREARNRFGYLPEWPDRPGFPVHDVSYFTLESTLCTYKGWHRKNRRYPNVYNDMAYDRLRKAEADWPERDFGIFWDARRAALPEYLRLEDRPWDPGLTPAKQNYYRETGRPIMMDRDFPELANGFNDSIDGQYIEGGPFR